MIESKSVLLVVEDSPEDFEALVRTFKKSNINVPLVHCESGDDALDYLYRREKYSHLKQDALPSMVLLDLNLPGTDGREILRTIKEDPSLQSMPVIVFTTSGSRMDIRQCYSLGANGYVQKPVSLKEMSVSMERLVQFWFETAKLPDDLSELL